MAQGVPAPQGSKSPKGRLPNGRVVMVESSKKVKPWRAAVRAAAITATRAMPVPAIAASVPVRVSGWVVFDRPKSVPMAKRRYPTVYPDLDKVLRSTGDALTGVVYADDGQIVGYRVEARYHDDPDVAHLGLRSGAVIHVDTV